MYALQRQKSWRLRKDCTTQATLQEFATYPNQFQISRVPLYAPQTAPAPNTSTPILDWTEGSVISVSVDAVNKVCHYTNKSLNK